ncbi:aldo/keto reductase [uncultured Amnibacterium sp.]|uniref:aldo/keto reductase n=1 Tax=uncultured Amnibacterium sp. TaxID=1631851 RepID=UPI0035CA6E7F
MTTALGGLPPYVYGTTRLGDESLPREQRLAMARTVLDAGLWIHTSDQYGDALQVLGEAIAEREEAPATIVKIGGGTADDVRSTILANIGPLGVDGVALGQLSPVSGLERSLAEGDARVLDGLRQLKSEGLVGRFVLEIFPWTSEAPLAALEAGHLDDLVDGFILYINPLQRFASNPLWDALQDRGSALISMRTVAGNDVRALRDVPGAAWRSYLRERAAEIAPIFGRSGVGDWAEFCVRFALGLPGVRSTVGSTSRREHLDAYLRLTRAAVPPLPQDVVDEILALHRRWSDETDVHAEPWTM